MKKVLIITVHHMNPIHPRIGKEIDMLSSNYIEVDYLSVSDIVKNNLKYNKIFRSLFINPYFKKEVLSRLKDKKEYDIYIFYDLHLLNVASYFKKNNKEKKVIYETIDDNISLSLYAHLGKIPLYKFWEKILLFFLRKFELKKAFDLDDTIVNSKELKKVFKNKAKLVYYTSIFEGNVLSQNIENSPALVYLGALTIDKGGKELLNFSKANNLKLFIFGDIEEKIKSDFLMANTVSYYGYLNANEILKELKKATENYFLFGVSFIKSLHNSYRIQIANKEIDYISLGIPIIGNKRLPTAELIEMGYGIYKEKFNDNYHLDNVKKMYMNVLCCEMFKEEQVSKSLINLIEKC